MQRAIWWGFGLLVAGGLYAGCTQNFDVFEPSGGSGGSTSSSSGAGNAGGGGGCQSANECPKTTKVCKVPACTDHACEVAAAPAGTHCASDGGKVCSAGGDCVACVHDSDCPQDDTGCAQYTCTPNNTCKAGTKPKGSSCGKDGDLTCDANGMCKGCKQSTQCGDDSDCVSFECNDTVCTQTNLQEGVAPPDLQTANDCKSVVCQAGLQVPQADITDTPVDDGNPCTDEQCNADMPIHPNFPIEHSCNGSNFCDGNGNCRACVSDMDCGTSTTCLTHTCNMGTHMCVTTTPDFHTTCSGGVCDGTGNCVECVTDAQCTSPETCAGGGTANVCGCTSTDTCGSLHATCGSPTNSCNMTIACDNSTKDPNETDVDCGGPASGNPHCTTRCGKGKHCLVGTDCVASANNCVDTVCCATACAAACMGCDQAGSVGTCSALPAGNDPGQCDDGNGSCGPSGTKCTCNATGACKRQNTQPCNVNGDCASNNCVGGPPGTCM